MYPDKMHIQHCMLYEFSRNKTAVEATKSICDAYPECALDVRTCQYWFARFKTGDYDLKDKERTGRPVEADDDFLEELLEEDPKQSTTELAIKLSVHQSTVCRRLQALGKVQKTGK